MVETGFSTVDYRSRINPKPKTSLHLVNMDTFVVINYLSVTDKYVVINKISVMGLNLFWSSA